VTNGPVTVRAGSSLGASDLIAQTVLDTGTHSLSCVPTGPSLCIQIESADQWNKTVTQCSIERGNRHPADAVGGDRSTQHPLRPIRRRRLRGLLRQRSRRSSAAVSGPARAAGPCAIQNERRPFNALPTIANVIMTRPSTTAMAR